MGTIPTIIRKSWFGYFQILLVGVGISALLVAVILLGLRYGFLTWREYELIGSIILVILGITAIQLYVYGLTTVALTATGIQIYNWTSLFTDRDSELEWSKIQDVSARQAGPFGQVIGFGTLLIQTAGTDTVFEVPMVPDVHHWVDVISKQAGKTPQLVKLPGDL